MICTVIVRPENWPERKIFENVEAIDKEQAVEITMKQLTDQHDGIEYHIESIEERGASTYRCITPFTIDSEDEDGDITEFVVEVGSIWRDTNEFFGFYDYCGPDGYEEKLHKYLENNDGQWIFFDKRLMEERFEVVE